MQDLVTMYESEPRVKTSDLWQPMGYGEHRALKRVISDNRDAFEEMGVLRTEMQKPKKGSKGGRPDESYLLNEDQFVLLVIMAKNFQESVKLKVRITKEFSRMKKKLAELAVKTSNQEWLELRKEGKVQRRLETDVIKRFIEYAKAQGGSVKGCDMYYSNLSKMENKALFIVSQKYPNLRDVLGLTELRTVQMADLIVAKALDDGMDAEMSYKDIYSMAKQRVEQFAEVRGVTPINLLQEPKAISHTNGKTQ